MYSHQLVISQIKAVQGGDGDGALGQVGDHVVTQVHLRRGDLQPEDQVLVEIILRYMPYFKLTVSKQF